MHKREFYGRDTQTKMVICHHCSAVYAAHGCDW